MKSISSRGVFLSLVVCFFAIALLGWYLKGRLNQPIVRQVAPVHQKDVRPPVVSDKPSSRPLPAAVQPQQPSVAVKLSKVRWLRGLVHAPDFRPIERFQASVYAAYEPFLSPICTQLFTDSQGVFELQCESSETIDLVIQAPGFVVSINPQLAMASTQEEAQPVDITLVPHSTIRGSVVTDEGAVVAGVRVDLGLDLDDAFEAEPASAEHGPSWTTADANGRFELKGIPQGDYSLFTQREGYFPATAPVFVGPGEVVDGVKLVLTAKGGSILVRVEERGHPPTKPYTVSIEDSPWKGKINSEGLWKVEGVQPGLYFVNVLSGDETAPGPAPVYRSAAQVNSAQEAEVVFRLQPSVVVRGEVLRGNKPGAAINIRVSQIAEHDAPARAGVLPSLALVVAKTDDQGRFELAPLPPGDYTVIARQENEREEEAAQLRLRLRPEDTYRSIQIHLGMSQLEGTVYDATTKQPIPKASMSMLSESPNWEVEGISDAQYATTRRQLYADADGLYRIERLSPGRYFFDVTAPGYGSLMDEAVNVEQPKTPHDFELYPQGQLVVVVINERNLPVYGAQVFLREIAKTNESLRLAMTNNQGYMRLSDVVPGSYELAVVLPGQTAPIEHVTITITSGQVLRHQVRITASQ